MLAQDVLTRAAIVLNDEQYVRWTVPELLHWLNEAAAAVVIARPPAGAVTETLTLVEGALQTLPEGAIQLLDIVANVDGKPVDRASRHTLDAQVPGWRVGKRKTSVRHFTFDERAPTTFYVYPPVEAGVEVEALYSRPPPEVTAATDNLDMDRAYIGPLVSYILYRAMAKDSEYANGQLSVAHYQAFATALGTQNQSTAAVSPNGADA